MESDLPRADDRAIAVRLRDYDSCIICNRGKSKANLEVHEIVKDDQEASRKLANYVLLCEEHHRKAHPNGQER